MTKISRSFDFRVDQTLEGDDGLTLEGYAAVFDSPSDITDWLGTYVETIARGAFTKTLSERSPLLQFDHGTHPMIGSIPLGTVKLAREDEQGLFVRARLSDNWLVQPVRDAIADGAIRGMSFQFQVEKDDWNDDKTERTIREVKLYELGPVVWPAYEATTVGVRSEISELLLAEGVRSELARLLTFGDCTKPADPEADAVTSEPAPGEPPPALVDKKTVAKMLRKAQMAGRFHPLLEEIEDVQEIA